MTTPTERAELLIQSLREPLYDKSFHELSLLLLRVLKILDVVHVTYTSERAEDEVLCDNQKLVSIHIIISS
jgi:hypothetical protein